MVDNLLQYDYERWLSSELSSFLLGHNENHFLLTLTGFCVGSWFQKI